MNLKFALLFLIIFAAASCNKKQFITKKQLESFSASALQVNIDVNCGDYTPIKPIVDILFVLDNTGSKTQYIYGTDHATLITSLQSTIDILSDRDYDYHLVIVPLEQVGGEDKIQLIVDNPTGLSTDMLGHVVPRDNIEFFEQQAGSSKEKGFQRAYDIITNNRSNGVFRNEAYTYVVVLSNEDDDWDQVGPYPSPVDDMTDRNLWLTNYTNLSTTLVSEQFRFMSIIGQNTCSVVDRKAPRYQWMSDQIYQAQLGSNSALDQGVSPTPDSYDLCELNFSHMFDGVNSSILITKTPHSYDHWPIYNTTGITYDTANIQAWKNTGASLTQGDTTNGFTYLGNATRDTRYAPTAGEPYTGHLLQLYGDGRIIYPECLYVQTVEPASYYGFVALDRKPELSTVVLKINGVTHSQSATNGWQYIGYLSSKNVKILSPSEPGTEGTPALLKTGYFLQLNGTAIFTNNSSVSVEYIPAAVE